MDMIRKTSGAAAGGMEFVLSDETVDSYGDVVEAAGWDLKRFKRNPIALFGHRADFPIGTWDDVRVDNGRLVGRLKLAKDGTSYRIDEVRRLVEQGILRAVSVGFRPVKKPEPMGKRGMRFRGQELLEASIVSVPANPATLSLAKSLNISDETLSMVFGEHAGADGMVVRGFHGEHAATPPTEAVSATKPRTHRMTLADKIKAAEADLLAKRDRLSELTNAEDRDTDAIEELNDQVEKCKADLASLKRSEMNIGVNASAASPTVPAAVRRPLGVGQKDLSGLDLMVRATLVNAVSMFGGKSVDQVLQERYPGHEATQIIAKADQTIGTTGVAGWASELMQTSYQGFIDALRGRSIYPELRARGVALNFDRSKTVYVPGLTAGGANGGFFAEGTPMRVGRVTTNSFTMTRRKMGVIVAFSREAAEQSTPQLEGIIRNAILNDTAAVLDSILLDAGAEDAVRPAGLLNGVAATASGYGGGDHIAVIEDFKALLKPFNDANALDGITVIMNPAQATAIDFMTGPDGVLGDWFARVRERFTFVESTHATANRLIAVRTPDFVTAAGDTPRFEMSTQATIHMEDTNPLEIVSGTGPTTADPVRSFFQTDTQGIKMVLDVAWKMRRAGMVRWIDGTSW